MILFQTRAKLPTRSAAGRQGRICAGRGVRSARAFVYLSESKGIPKSARI